MVYVIQGCDFSIFIQISLFSDLTRMNRVHFGEKILHFQIHLKYMYLNFNVVL